MDSLNALETSLDNLEKVLGPLLAQSLPETLENLDLLQKAKLQVLIPYVLNDLVFIYLKSRGINPKTHPVVGELERVKQYFDKIRNAEDPEKRRLAVDQGAATRFIKHAIQKSQIMQQEDQRELKQNTHHRFTGTSQLEGTSQSGAPVLRFTDAALAKIRARETTSQRAGSSDEEDELEVIADAPSLNPVGNPAPDEEEAGGHEVPQTSSKKKKRRGMDPWSGYDNKDSSGASTPMGVSKHNQHRKRTRKG